MHFKTPGEYPVVLVPDSAKDECLVWEAFSNLPHGSREVPTNGASVAVNQPMQPNHSSLALIGLTNMALPVALDQGETLPLLNPDITETSLAKILDWANQSIDNILEDPA